MREQILRKFTQIPDHLYVKRKADDQIKRNIEEMLRPGYVSVARQMGKTNLLQYAQRTLQGPDQIIVYIDVTSSHYEDVRDYFNYIIDTILESNPGNFSECSKEIYNNRKNLNLAPAKEHQNELRNLLKKFPGKIIIILDEVDSLVNYEFSDQIFAQIRSIYFMKNTFKEFTRLSYLLSGVIEPNRVIKSKENSPFNIAQKLYLDDFTEDEFLNFIIKCELDVLDIDVIRRIYYWTNGNPRMTYDVCAEVENLYILEGNVSQDDIDQIIEKFYLVRYDQAPVDHIRDLLYNNVILRNAVQDLRRNENISDDLKSQLYLYGVINSDFAKPKIKNLIVDRSLSEDWMTNIEIDNKGLYKYGLDCISNRQYPEAINALTKFIEENSSSSNGPLTKYYLGLAYFEIKNYNLSNSYLLPIPLTDRSFNIYLYRRQFFILGNNYWHLNQDDKAEEYYILAIEENMFDDEHLYALLNLSAVYNRVGNHSKVVEINKRILSDLDKSKNIAESTTFKLSTNANYNIGRVKESLKNYDEAITWYNKALLTAQVKNKPSILLRRFICSEGKESGNDDIIEAVNLIIDNNITINKDDSSAAILLSRDEITSLFMGLSIKKENSEKFESLVHYTSENIDKISREEFLLDLVSTFNTLGMYSPSEDILDKVLNSDITSKVRIRAIKYSALLNRIIEKPYIPLFLQYYDLLKKEEGYNIENADISLMTNVVMDLWGRKDYRSSLKFAKDVLKILETGHEDLQYNKAMMLFTIADSNFKMGNALDAKLFALDCDKVILKLKAESKNLVDSRSSFLSTMSTKVSELLSYTRTFNNILQPTQAIVINPSKIGRNDIVKVRYMNGSDKEGKFKLFEKDVNNKLCEVIEKK